MLLEGGQQGALKLRILSRWEFRESAAQLLRWTQAELLSLRPPCASRLKMQCDWCSGTGWLVFPAEADRFELERVLSFHHWKLGRQTVPRLCSSRSHYSRKWMNWPLEVGLPRVLKDAPLCHITARPSLCFWKSLPETHIPLHLWSLIYQPTPQRRNNKIKKNNKKTSGYKTQLCIMLCWLCV